MLAGWGLTGVEGFLSAYLAGNGFAQSAYLSRQGPRMLNTDDLSPVEFGFARGLGRGVFSVAGLRLESRRRGVNRPALAGEEISWERVDSTRQLDKLWRGERDDQGHGSFAELVYEEYLSNRHERVLQSWVGGLWQPTSPMEEVMLAESLAAMGDDRVFEHLPRVAEYWPASAAAIEARFFLRRGDAGRSMGPFAAAITGFRASPWDSKVIMRNTLFLGVELAKTDRRLAPGVFDLLEQPFSVRILDGERIMILLTLAKLVGPGYCERGLAQTEPNVFWDERILRFRSECYAATGNPLAARARGELAAFETQQKPVGL